MEKMWKTSISKIEPNEIRLRGYRIDELMGRISFAQAIYLTLTGDLPSPEEGKLLDAMLVSSIDHGVSPPSTLAARNVASTGAALNAAVATGILAINKYHGGAIQDAMEVILSALERMKTQSLSLEMAAAEVVDSHQAAGLRLPGLGHRIHKKDPRTSRLFQLAQELGLAGSGLRMIHALRDALAQVGPDLPINVDGALAALLVDLNLTPKLANAFFLMARLPGLVAQVHEEQTRERPMRDILPDLHQYDGPEDRSP